MQQLLSPSRCFLEILGLRRIQQPRADHLEQLELRFALDVKLNLPLTL